MRAALSARKLRPRRALKRAKNGGRLAVEPTCLLFSQFSSFLLLCSSLSSCCCCCCCCCCSALLNSLAVFMSCAGKQTARVVRVAKPSGRLNRPAGGALSSSSFSFSLALSLSPSAKLAHASELASRTLAGAPTLRVQEILEKKERARRAKNGAVSMLCSGKQRAHRVH